MSTKAVDLTGQQYGTLTVLRLADEKSIHNQRQWVCQCECGNVSVILGGSLRSGNTKKCNDHPKNTYRIEGDAVVMDVSTLKHPSKETIFDVDDLDKVINFKNKQGRMRWMYTDSSEKDDVKWGKYVMGSNRKTSLHRTILDMNDRVLIVDHVNGNTLDNRRKNLRIVTRAENNKNMRQRSTNTTGGTGVQIRNGLYVATIQLKYRKLHIGTYDTLSDANIAYRAAAKALEFSERHGLK